MNRGSRGERNSAELALLKQKGLIMQVVRHGNDEEEDHQGTGHGHDSLPLALEPPGGSAGAHQHDDLHQNPNNRHTYPHEIESKLQANLIIVSGANPTCKSPLRGSCQRAGQKEESYFYSLKERLVTPT